MLPANEQSLHAGLPSPFEMLTSSYQYTLGGTNRLWFRLLICPWPWHMHLLQASGARLLASISHTQQLCMHDLAQLDDPDSEPEAAAEEATPAQVSSGAEVDTMLAFEIIH